MVMNIRLSVVGAARPESHVFGEEGGTFGRSQKCDWILSDEERILSSVHGRVTFKNGTFFLADESTNGIFPDGSDEPLGKGSAVAVASGDRFHAGRYLIEAQIVEVHRQARARASVDATAAFLAEAEGLQEEIARATDPAAPDPGTFWDEGSGEPLAGVETVSADDGLADIFPAEHAFEAPVAATQEVWDQSGYQGAPDVQSAEYLNAPAPVPTGDFPGAGEALEPQHYQVPDRANPATGGQTGPFQARMPAAAPVSASGHFDGAVQGNEAPAHAPTGRYSNGSSTPPHAAPPSTAPAPIAPPHSNGARPALRRNIIPEEFDPLSILPSRSRPEASTQAAGASAGETRGAQYAQPAPPERPAAPRQPAVQPAPAQHVPAPPAPRAPAEPRPRALSPSLMADLVEPGAPEAGSPVQVDPRAEAMQLAARQQRPQTQGRMAEGPAVDAPSPQPRTGIHLPPAAGLALPAEPPMRSAPPAAAAHWQPAPQPRPQQPVRAPAQAQPPAQPGRNVRPMPAAPQRQTPAQPNTARMSAPAPQPQRTGAPVGAPAAAGRPEADRAVLSALLSAMGFPQTEIDPHDHLILVGEVGEMLRAMSEGLIAVLAARRGVMDELQVEGSARGMEDDNPFKVFKIAELALDEMFVTRSGGYQDPVEATRAAFEDLQQFMSLIGAAMQRAMILLLERLSPEEIGNERADEGGIRIPGLGARKNKWEAYVESHARMSRNIEAVARQIIGEAFSQLQEQDGRQ